MELLCNIFNGVYDTNCLNVVKVTSIFSAIKNGRWEKEVTDIRNYEEKNLKKILKEKLPAVTFAGVFEDSKKDNNLVHYNHLMVADIDKVTSKQLKSLKDKLKHNPYVLAYFVSPNYGLKVVIPVDAVEHKHNTDSFYCVEKMFKDMYNIQIDKSGKNLARLCFVSYDPELFYNPDCLVLPIESNFNPEDGFVKVNTESVDLIPTNDANKILETCIKMVKASKTGRYVKGNRNKYVFVLSCLMCEFGVNYEQSLHLIFERYNSLGFPEVRNTVASAFRRNKNNFATKSVNERMNTNQINLEL